MESSLIDTTDRCRAPFVHGARRAPTREALRRIASACGATAILTIISFALPDTARAQDSEALSVAGYEFVSRARVGILELDLEYRVVVQNESSSPIAGAAAVVRVDNAGAELLDDRAVFSVIPPGATASSEDTISVRFDRRLGFDPSQFDARLELPPDLEFVLADNPAVVAPIGPAGGEFFYAAPEGVTYTVSIPPAALANELSIAMTDVLLDDRVEYSGIVSALDFGPDGTVFDRPITVTIDLTAVANPGQVVLPIITDADGNRGRLLFNFARYSDGSIIPNVYDVLVPHFSVVTIEGEEFICEDYLGNGISEVCIPVGAEDGEFGPNYGNPVADGAKAAVADVLYDLAERQATGEGSFTDEELEIVDGALNEWGNSIDERLDQAKNGGYAADPELNENIVADALTRATLCQLLSRGCDDTGLGQARTSASQYEDFVLGQCNSPDNAGITLDRVLKNAATLQILGSDTQFDIGDGSAPPKICPLPDFSGEYSLSSSGSVFGCEDEEDDGSFSVGFPISLGGATTASGPSSADVSLSGSGGGGGVSVSISLSFSIELDELGKASGASGGGGGGAFSEPEGSGTFGFSGGVTAAGNRFSLSGSGSGTDGDCSGSGSISIN